MEEDQMQFANPTHPTLAECSALMQRNGGSLYLSRTAITTLPEGLSVGGSLNLIGTAITTLPEGLSVGGSLYLSRSAITTLPEGLSVGGSLDLIGTAIPVVYCDRRGYELRRIMCGAEEWWVAGCRKFTSRADALAHWGADDYPDQKRGAAYCEAIRNTPEDGQ
jgi:hypothetical protein